MAFTAGIISTTSLTASSPLTRSITMSRSQAALAK